VKVTNNLIYIIYIILRAFASRLQLDIFVTILNFNAFLVNNFKI